MLILVYKMALFVGILLLLAKSKPKQEKLQLISKTNY